MEYYINVDNKKQGPYNLKELAERKIEATTLLWLQIRMNGNLHGK